MSHKEKKGKIMEEDIIIIDSSGDEEQEHSKGESKNGKRKRETQQRNNQYTEKDKNTGLGMIGIENNDDNDDFLTSPSIYLEPEPVHQTKATTITGKKTHNQEKEIQKQEEDNPYITLSVHFPQHQRHSKFFMLQKEKFQEMITYYCSREKITPNEVDLQWKGFHLDSNQTPQHYKFSSNESVHFLITKDDKSMERVENRVRVAVRMLKKESKKYNITKSSSFQKLFDKICLDFKMEMNNFKLQFDGENINPAQKPDDYGIEDDDLIDIVEVKK